MRSWRNVCLIVFVLVSLQSDLTGEETQKNGVSPAAETRFSGKDDIELYEAIQRNLDLNDLGKVKGSPMAKVGGDLAALYEEYESFLQNSAQQGESIAFKPANFMLRTVDNRVVVDAVASGDVNALKSDLEAIGMQNIAVSGRFVSGQLPILAVDDMAALDSLQFARPAYAKTNVGSVNSQGDRAMRSDTARTTFGVDGTGVTVGILSDSYNCLGGAASNVASGDLPSGIVVLDDEDSCIFGSDEGRGMMQLIADVAPGARQAFHTASNGVADFASGIVELATTAGADVIVDDVIYLTEPMFQDGEIAQAVDTVVGMGVPYFSSAGENGRNSYVSSFRPSGTDLIVGSSNAGELHDFDPGPGVDTSQLITIPQGGSLVLVLQWDSPFFSVSGAPGSPNNIDIFLYNSNNTVLHAFSADVNIGNDAVEVLTFNNLPGSGATSFNIRITNSQGPNPGLMKYVLFSSAVTVNEFNAANSTLYGHANAAGAEAVGAAFFGNTPPFGTDPAILEDFSSAGPTRIFFRTDGSRLPTPETRQKPEIIAPDGSNTTFFGEDIPFDTDLFPNFFGTSAAAAHAAGVAALMLDRNPNLSPASIYTILENTADDMLAPGFDFDSGFGYIQADGAVGAVPLTTFRCNGLIATIIGTPGADIINGTPNRDIIQGRDGNDVINGLGGNDLICAGPGDDTVNGGDGTDVMFGGPGNDTCNGGPPASGDTATDCETVTNVP